MVFVDNVLVTIIARCVMMKGRSIGRKVTAKRLVLVEIGVENGVKLIVSLVCALEMAFHPKHI